MRTVRTNRLTMRNFRPDDWRDLHEMIVQYQASGYAQYDHEWPTSEEEIQGIARWFSQGDDYLAACLNETGKLIGLVAMNKEQSEDGPAFNLGYVFNFDYHGRGYATEACLAVIDFAFRTLNAAIVVSGTAAANQPSRRLLARLGLHDAAPGGTRYQLSHDEWLARNLA